MNYYATATPQVVVVSDGPIDNQSTHKSPSPTMPTALHADGTVPVPEYVP